MSVPSNNPFLSLATVSYQSILQNWQLSGVTSEGEAMTSDDLGWSDKIGLILSYNLTFSVLPGSDLSGIVTVLFNAWKARNSLAFVVARDGDNTSPSTTNPNFTGTILVSNWNLSANIGQMFQVGVTYPGKGALNMVTS